MDDPALAELVIRSLYSARLLCIPLQTRRGCSPRLGSQDIPREIEKTPPSEARAKAARNVLVRNWLSLLRVRSFSIFQQQNEILYMPIPIAISLLEEMKRPTWNYHQKVRTY